MSDGIIKIDSEFANTLGFTSDKFHEKSYLWKKGDYIYVSFIISKQPGKGSFSNLVKRILALGYGVKVPTPSAAMSRILQHLKFKRSVEYWDEVCEWVEVWVRKRLDKETSPTVPNVVKKSDMNRVKFGSGWERDEAY